MCILIHRTPDTSFSDDVLRDFYDHNPDGFGVMFGDGKKMHITKSLGSVEETIALYRDICEGRECIIHYRMRTHGNIDTANCHPYRITDDLWLAHNGILSAGNPINQALSDTWHMIEYILRPIAERNADLLFTADFQTYLGDLIGTGNKFALCHADGRIAVINREAGVEHFGAWLSNTYAWSTTKFGFKTTTTTGYKGYFGFDYEDYYNGYYDKYQPSTSAKKSLGTTDETLKPLNYAKVCRAAYNSWRRGGTNLLKWVEQAPEKAKFFLAEWYDLDGMEVDHLVDNKPEEAACWIADLFETESVNESHFN